MGLRCLLGHDFGEPETERERNEEGNEVVVSVREVKTCRRCGEKQVVSENKEIKSIDQLRESATGGAGGAETGAAGATEPSGTGRKPTGTQEPAETNEEPARDFGGQEPEPSTGGDDQWSAEELEIGETSGETRDEPESVAPADEDVDRGVAEIIENAEKDDEMLQTEPEQTAGAEEAAGAEAEEAAVEAEPAESADGETPVHPAERGPDEDEEEETAHEDEDAVILDEESPPEEGREQWDEQAHPEEVPGRDKSGAEPRAPDDEDAVIMGGDERTEPEPEPDPEPEPTREQPREQPTTDSSPDRQPTAVESEDAEIMGSETADPEPDPEPEPTHDADAPPTTAEPPTEESSSRETTEDGHMPWPEAPGEDEGHDAEAPDGEPADLEFGGGITPEQPKNEQNGAEDATANESSAEPTTADEAAAGDADVEEEQSTTGGNTAPEPNINLEQSSREAGMEYYCSECGLTRDVGNSSMRAGDICPECRKGYITEREKSQ